MGVARILVKFKDRPMFSHTIQKVSARSFHWKVAEHGSTWKNNQNTYSRFSFIPKTGLAFPEVGILFLLWTYISWQLADNIMLTGNDQL